MKIGEVARAVGVTTSRIRFYERKGIIAAAERGANGYRNYPRELIAHLKFIEQAQSLGFTLREISRIQPQPGEHIISCSDALVLLAEKHRAVCALIEMLMAELDRSATFADQLELMAMD